MSENGVSENAPVQGPGSQVPLHRVLGVAGALIVAVSVFLTWGTDELFGDGSRNALRVPMQMLWDTTPASLDSFPVGWLVLAGAATTLLGALGPGRRVVGLLGSVLSLVMAVLWLNGVRLVLADPLYDIDASLTECVGAGVWVCILGSLISGAGAVVGLQRAHAG